MKIRLEHHTTRVSYGPDGAKGMSKNETSDYGKYMKLIDELTALLGEDLEAQIISKHENKKQKFQNTPYGPKFYGGYQEIFSSIWYSEIICKSSKKLIEILEKLEQFLNKLFVGSRIPLIEVYYLGQNRMANTISELALIVQEVRGDTST